MGGKAKATYALISAVWAKLMAIANKIAIFQIFGILKTIWNTFKPIWDQISKIYSVLKQSVIDLYLTYIKPILGYIDVIFSKIEEVVDWFDKLYKSTIGRVEDIYNETFGRIEDLWKRFEDFRDRMLRLIAVLNKDLAQQLYDTTEKLEASTIGRIRDLKDDLLHQIDKVYTELRDRINDFYYALKDLIKPVQDAVHKFEDFLAIAFEKPDLLSRKTIVTSADTYGQEWWNSTIGRITPRSRRMDVEVMLRGTIRTKQQEVVQEMDKGKQGTWADVYNYIQDSVALMDAGGDPASFEADPDLLSTDDLKESLEVPRAPDDPVTLTEEEAE